MEEISHLIAATPKVFHQVLAHTNTLTGAHNIRCLVDPNFIIEDEIDDMFQAVIDICTRHVAQNRLGNVKITLEYPDIASIDINFDVSRSCELFKKSGPSSSTITMKVMYFNSRESKYHAYFQDIKC